MNLGRLTALAGLALVLAAPAGAHGVSEEIEQLAALLQLRPGMQLADVGAGDGEFAEALADRIGPTGHVFTNEIDDDQLRKIRRRIEKSDLTNMSVVEGGTKDTHLPERSCDRGDGWS